jgi:peptidoglycan/xylan/chitin deacetylase (PgdA/CDA1 family)
MITMANQVRRIGTPVIGLLVVTLLAGCGADAPTPATVSPPLPTVALSPLPAPSPTAEATPSLSSVEVTHPPNELGQVLVLEYHTIDDGGGVFTRSPEQFRDDLEWLHEHDFYVIPVRDYLANEIKAPAGQRPVLLTFDDGVVSQFRYTADASGGWTLDPNSAVAVLEEFFNEHPDFGRGGLFSILPLAPFAWPDAPDQLEYAEEKLQWLLANGYEIGNHTLGHNNLGELTSEEAMEDLAAAVDLIHEYVPDAPVEVIVLPFGMYPPDESVLHGFDYQGQRYEFDGALMIGAGPALSPAHDDFDPFDVPRIQASDEELGKWFSYVEDNPGLIYVSDGTP